MAFEIFDVGRAVTYGDATGVVEKREQWGLPGSEDGPVRVRYLIRFEGEDEPCSVDSPGVEAVDPFEGTDGPETNELPAGADGPFGKYDPGTPDFGKHDPGTPDFDLEK